MTNKRCILISWHWPNLAQKGKHISFIWGCVTQQTLVKCGQRMIPMIGHWTKLSRSGQLPNVANKMMPLIRGLCLTADFDQMWSKLCPSLEDFVTQQTLTKCGPNWAPHWRTLSRSGLWSNVAQIVPLIGGLYYAADFSQMWPKLCTLSEDFVMQQTLTKCGPKCAPCQRTLSHCRPQPNVVWAYAPPRRTLSHSGLWPNVVETCAPQWRTLFCYGVWPHMDQQCTHNWKRPVPNNWILIVDQRKTKTAISNYVAKWSIC